MATTRKKHGVTKEDLTPSIRPQDDFYLHTAKKWLDANLIPKSESRWGTFTKLIYETDFKLKAILEELDKQERLPAGSPEQMLRDFYRAGMDMKRRNALDAKPIEHLFKKIRAIKTQHDLQTVLIALHRIGVSSLWGAGVDQDAKKSTQYRLHLGQDGLGLPDRDYYLKDDAESKRVRDAYIPYAEKMFTLIGYGKTDAKQATENLLSVETQLAKASMRKEDVRDPEKTYHKMSVTALAKLAPNVDWNRYFAGIGGKDIREVIVLQPEFLKAVNGMLSTVSLEAWKQYLEWHTANYFASALSDRFIKHQFSFYGTVLTGTTTVKPLWRRVLRTINADIGELLGRLYVERYFPEEAKRKMDVMIDDLFAAYEARLKSLTWMSPATKKKAINKLHALNRKIGYPKKWRSYKGLAVRADDHLGNILRATEIDHKRIMRKLNGPIDRGEWFMLPHTVNAYFTYNLNDIVFPAGILQPPFFDPEADDAYNYGCMGMTIGHEITHGFDYDGSKFDKDGNMKVWWLPEDRKRFEAKAKNVEKQYDQYEVADGLKVNGKLTISENIADLGGLSIAYDAYQLALARDGRTDIDGFSPEQRFFMGFAVFEWENTRPEAQKLRVLNDTHSPGQFRINGPLSNFAPFYEAYGVKKGDKLYRDPKNREMVW